MTSASLESPTISQWIAQPPYRALSSAAVSSAAMGALSVLALFDWAMGLIPLLGLASGLFALRQIRRRDGELTGRSLAFVGIGLSLALWIVGWSRLGYVYATEVPEGYRRISYEQLQPDSNVPGQIVPPAARALSGERVFVKGYVYPPANPLGVRSFLLVRDSGECCFGGNPKITERIQVTLAEPADLTRASGVHKVAGVFRVEPGRRAVDGPGGILYHLDEAMLR